MSMLLRLFGFVLLLIVAVAALAPATLLAPPIARESGGVLTLVEAAGTVWSGRGTLFAAGERIPVAWKVEPAAILGGELAVRLTGQDAARPLPRALISASLDRLAATNVEIALPAAALLAAAGTPAPVVLDGVLRLRSAALERRGTEFAGGADLAWDGARIGVAGSPQSFDLGSIAIALTGGGDRLRGPVTNRGGKVALAGEAGIDARGAVTLDVLVTPRAPLDGAAVATLRALAQPEGDGWRLRWPARAR
jgi:hypothetical protein